jgi:hypothetical protein
MLFHTLAVAGAWGLGAAGLSYLTDSMTSRKREADREADVKPGVKATYVPLMQSDLSLKDKHKKGNVFEMGKEAQDTSIPGRRIIPKDKQYYYMFVLPSMAAVLAASWGLKGGANIYREERESELDKEISANSKKLDDLTLERLQWSRKSAGSGPFGLPTWQETKDLFSKGKGDFASLFTAGVIGTFSLSALAAYAMARKSDPNIARYKALERGFKELARSQSRGTGSYIRPLPVELEEELDAAAAKHPKPELAVSTSQSVPVDPTDQSMKLL